MASGKRVANETS